MYSQLFSLLFPGTVLLLYIHISISSFRVWEKFMEAIKSKAPTGGVKKMISSWAKGKGQQGSANMQKGLVE